jgi:biopolymer transport protein ExbB
MSIITWYLIITKATQVLAARRRSARFLDLFWNSASLGAVATQLEQDQVNEPFSNLAYHAIVAARHHQLHGADKLDQAGNGADFLTRAIRRAIDEETARLESGLMVLASIGSTAPFVGLFGTVWGVYHALIAIGASGQGTLDKVAGPVGEALIMTAFGLAVAIPAVLGYNAFVRFNRLTLAQLDSFAHDLFSFLTTGSHVSAPLQAAVAVTPVQDPAAAAPLQPAAAARRN